MKVRFKEVYMLYPVERECKNMTEEQIVKVYGLKEKDIEWYKFIENENQ